MLGWVIAAWDLLLLFADKSPLRSGSRRLERSGGGRLRDTLDRSWSWSVRSLRALLRLMNAAALRPRRAATIGLRDQLI